MTYFSRHDLEHLGGICFLFENNSDLLAAKKVFYDWSEQAEAQAYLSIAMTQYQQWFLLQISASDTLRALTPSYNTVDLSVRLGQQVVPSSSELDLEIVLSMARGPRAYCFPSCDEFFAALRIRRLTVLAARQTQLAFDPEGLERPAVCWTYQEDKGFTLNAGVDLITALTQTTQPFTERSSYTFSCFRASEYVLLLALTQELKQTHPLMLVQIETLWRTRALLADDFNDAFMHEHGKLETPLPMKFYVPGDRVWFRNPDEASADIKGFEGSWVCYLGGGQFSNFWDRAHPYTLEQKCLEVYHWRHGVTCKPSGERWMDESIVQELVLRSAKNNLELQEILFRMMSVRDARGTYAEGGCIDATRDAIRWVCPATADINLNNIVS
jgi:hypothetical protein